MEGNKGVLASLVKGLGIKLDLQPRPVCGPLLVTRCFSSICLKLVLNLTPMVVTLYWGDLHSILAD